METINIQTVKDLLKKKGIRQNVFSKAIDMKDAGVSAAFHGKRTLPMKKILVISKFLGVSPFTLVK